MENTYTKETELDALRAERKEMAHHLAKLEEELLRVKGENRELKELVIKLNMRYLVGY